MAMPNHAKSELMKGTFDFVNDTIKVLLLDDSSAYTYDPDDHEYVDDVLDSANDADAGNEMSGTGYSRKTLSNVTVTQENTPDEGQFDADNVTWTGLNAGTIQTIVVFRLVNDDTDSEVLAVLDDDSAGSLADLPLSTNGSDVTIQWDSTGIIKTA